MSRFLCALNRLIEIVSGNKTSLHVYLARESSEEVIVSGKRMDIYYNAV